jgi:hypothetical protein
LVATLRFWIVEINILCKFLGSLSGGLEVFSLLGFTDVFEEAKKQVPNKEK